MCMKREKPSTRAKDAVIVGYKWMYRRPEGYESPLYRGERYQENKWCRATKREKGKNVQWGFYAYKTVKGACRHGLSGLGVLVKVELKEVMAEGREIAYDDKGTISVVRANKMRIIEEVPYK